MLLASGEDVNIMVFDTEVYSNTGGQASKASQIGQVAQFAAAGKAIAKKALAEIAMSYGYIYVAQIAMGADQNQTIKAITEAEAYPGPSLIIGYAPCEMHGIKGGMVNCQAEMKKAVGLRLLATCSASTPRSRPRARTRSRWTARLRRDELPRLHHERGALYLSDPFLPGACRGAVRQGRAERDRPL